MSRFQVIEVTGKFVVKSDTETLAVMDSRDAAEFACEQLNYEPGVCLAVAVLVIVGMAAALWPR